jgi:hypothetical protein
LSCRTAVSVPCVWSANRKLAAPAELDIAAQATMPRVDNTGQVTTDTVNCSHCDQSGGLGQLGRNSDPTIAQMVNGAAANGCFLTIPDPVKVYIQKLDLTGWTGPAGIDTSTCWKIVRGTPAVRASFSRSTNSMLSVGV